MTDYKHLKDDDLDQMKTLIRDLFPKDLVEAGLSMVDQARRGQKLAFAVEQSFGPFPQPLPAGNWPEAVAECMIMEAGMAFYGVRPSEPVTPPNDSHGMELLFA